MSQPKNPVVSESHSPVSSSLWKVAECAVIEGDASGLDRLLREHPKLRDETPPAYVARGPRPKYTEGDAQSIIANEHCFPSYKEFAEYLEAVRRADSAVALFEAAVDAVVEGNITALKRLLARHPNLTRERSSRRHHATLLHYVGANGVEGFRQKTPRNITAITETLLKRGAEADAIAEVYGNSTTLSLVATSIHPSRAGVQLELLDILLRAGASVDGGVSGVPSALISALQNGRPEAAVHLAEHGAHLSLEGAAGVGRMDAVKKFFTADGKRKRTATAKQLADGFAWACLYGRTNVVEFLIQRADKATCNAGLHSAVASGNMKVLRMLLRENPSLEARNVWGATALGTAVWSAANNELGIDYAPCIEALIAAGASVDADPGLKESIEVILRRPRTRPM